MYSTTQIRRLKVSTQAPSDTQGPIKISTRKINSWIMSPNAARARLQSEAGAATAEYVIATMAAVGFAGLLVVIMRSDEVRGMLTDLVRTALTVVG